MSIHFSSTSMDHHPANYHQNLDDHHYSFHYFNQYHDTHFYRDDDAFEYLFDPYNLQFYNLLDMNRFNYDLGFPYFDPIDEHLSLWDCWDDGCNLPLLSCGDDHGGESKVVATGGDGGGGGDGGRNGWRRAALLELEEIQKYFEMPIAIAAEKLGVGLTMLKKRCRELDIKRWPHRKLKSIRSLIQNVKEMGLSEEMEMLEEQKRMITKVPEMELTKRTKKLRQACFKATYKKRRLIDSPSLSLNHL